MVIPGTGTVRADIGVRAGRIVALADEISASDAAQVVDARDRLVFPGAVDAHFHIGIYRPIGEDAESETRSALVGGVTSVISYFRTGGHYLEKTGSYKDILPEVLDATAGRAFADYAYHLGLMTTDQLDEVDWLIDAGVSSFKYYMFYKGLNLTASSTDTTSLTMTDTYDLGHLYRMMQAVASASRRVGAAGRVSLSLHCEQSEIMRTTIEEVQRRGLTGLEAYDAARPPFQERLAIAEATLLADVTGCPVNLLHLSSGEALEGGVKATRDYPDSDIQLETTLHHLSLAREHLHGLGAKVNPPIRSEREREALWKGVLDGSVSQIVSDHACCVMDNKDGGTWGAYAGFGGSGLMYPVVFTEGSRRGLSPTRIAELLSANPARNFGLYPKKGTIAIGADADLAILDPVTEAVVSTDRLMSAQDHTPFAGMPLTGWPSQTILRGELTYDRGKVIGQPRGEYLRRPVGYGSPTDALESVSQGSR